MVKWKYGAANKNVIDIQAIFKYTFVCDVFACLLFASIGEAHSLRYKTQLSYRIVSRLLIFESEYICCHVDRLLF